MAENDSILQRRGEDLYDADGDKIGSIEEIYLDADTDEPAWAVVQSGLFGTKRTFVPLRGVSDSDGALTVPYEKETAKNAPRVDHDGALTRDEEAALQRHYGVEPGP